MSVVSVGRGSVGTGSRSLMRRPHGNDLEIIGQANLALSVLNGKWKLHLLFSMARGIHRFSHLLDCLPGASKKVMSESLRALERDGVVCREVFAEVPVRVEYSLTALGWTVTEPLMALASWGAAYAKERDELDGGSDSRTTARKGATRWG
jgi:DNA-binding HxlR family transcriptional regulator